MGVKRIANTFAWMPQKRPDGMMYRQYHNRVERKVWCPNDVQKCSEKDIATCAILGRYSDGEVHAFFGGDGVAAGGGEAAGGNDPSEP